MSSANEHRLSPGEGRALAALYHQTNGDRWRRNEGWLTDADPCTWLGVTCESGHVTALHLSQNRLEGTLPSELALLAYLRHLDLSDNALTGRIPDEIGNLRYLATLNLANNHLGGTLPDRLRLLRRLRVLDLRDNRLNGPIPPFIRDLTSLEHLHLSHNQFSGEVPPELGRLTHLVTLALSHNPLRGPLPTSLTRLTALAHFSFDHTHLSEPTEPEFQAWLQTIDVVKSTEILHTEVVRPGNLGLATLAGASTLGAALATAGLVLLPLLGPVAGAIFALGGAAGAGLVGKKVYELTRSPDRAPSELALTAKGGDSADEALKEELRQQLRSLVRAHRPGLPPDAADELDAIEQTLLEMLPRIKHLGGGDPDAYTVRQTIRDYLPEALRAYHALPAAYAAEHPLQTGQTAHSHLLQQLQTIRRALDEIAERLPEQAAQKLLVHGRFIRGRFRRDDDA